MRLHSPRESYLWLKALWEHRRGQRLSRSELEAAQLAKFRRLVAFAQGHSPYYRRVIAEQGIKATTCVPTDFPILTKEEVARNFDELVTDRTIKRRDLLEFLGKSSDPAELYRGKYHVLHTSGTSGTMGIFIYSHEGWIQGASNVVRASPLRLRMRVAYIAATRGHFAGVSLMLSGNDGTNGLFYNVRTFDVGQPLEEIVAGLNKFQPQAVSGYGTMLKALAEAQERGELRIRPRHMGNGGEPLLPETKAYLERIFGIPMMNGYASSEHLYMAMTLQGISGMYLLEDNLIFELGSDYTCVTNLFNQLMPLIRYRMDDVLVPEVDPDRALPFTRIREVVGRKEDALVFTNQYGREDFIHPIVIVELVVAGLNSWQVVLESRTSFRFRARLDPGLLAEARAATIERLRGKLQAILAEKEMANVSFTIEEVHSLSIDARTGKFRLVVPEHLA